MFKDNKIQVSALVQKETKQRFDKIKKECPLKNDHFVNYLLDLYEKEQNQQKEGKYHE